MDADPPAQGVKIARRMTVSKRGRLEERPVAGTILCREWKGIEHRVTVRPDGYEYQGRPYKSLSAVARAIAGTRWNGHIFFGLKTQRQGRRSK